MLKQHSIATTAADDICRAKLEADLRMRCKRIARRLPSQLKTLFAEGRRGRAKPLELEKTVALELTVDVQIPREEVTLDKLAQKRLTFGGGDAQVGMRASERERHSNMEGA